MTDQTIEWLHGLAEKGGKGVVNNIDARCLGRIADDLRRLRTMFDFTSHLFRQREWSEKTFGPGSRAQGIVDHIRKELREIEADPSDLTEWIDVVILALDGAWRSGANPHEIIAALIAKQKKNENRDWPDWRTSDPDKAIEHVRAADEIATAD